MSLKSAFCVWLFLLAFPAVAVSQNATISAAVNLVKVPFSIFDESGRMVQNPSREDFRLYENGVQQQIRSFGLDKNSVSVVLLIDTSGSVERELKEIRSAAQKFAEALVPEDRISIITFADEVTLALDWTENKRKVRKALSHLEPGFRTALYDAMYMAAYDQLRSIEGRKAIILLTDGLNNQSTLGFHDASLSVIQSQASLYVVSKTAMMIDAARRQRRVVMLSRIYKRLTGEDDYVDEFFKKKETEMTDLCEKTGGRALFPTRFDQITGVYQEVARELKSKFFLTYISNQGKAPNSYHQISLEYLQPTSKIVYRRGYYFEPAPIHKRRY